jgi:hypothetical protein
LTNEAKHVSRPDGGNLMALITCPECKQRASDTAEACPSCGFAIKGKPKWNRGIAALLSLIIPGAGQMYKGQVLNGLVWLIVVVVGYAALVVPGVLLHLCCIAGASMGDPTK